MQRIWNIHKPDVKLKNKLSQDLGVSQVISGLLINRGIKETKAAQKYLRPALGDLFDPFAIPDMPKAVKRLRSAVTGREKVMIFGDYDVDGLTAAALLESQFSKAGLKAFSYIPHRIKHGYGLNNEAIKIAVERKVTLLLTVDCGISNHKEIEEFKRRNIDVIVTDHHEPAADALPDCLAVVDPKRKDSKYPFRDLAGVGVAYKLAQCVLDENLDENLDLVLLGTVADMVPLTGENRILAKLGLEQITCTQRPGIRALFEASRLKSDTFSTESISYILAPRINASGRMDSADSSLELLLTQSSSRAAELARILCKHNQERQKVERKILEEAADLIGKEVNFKEHNVIVLAKEGWHQGVLGIVASKIMDKFYRPTVVISLNDGLCKGSCRSVKNFHIFDALWNCKDLLESFGGHKHAAGLLILKDNIPEFRHQINRLAKSQMLLEDLLPSLDVDMEVSLTDLSSGLIEDLGLLSPYGAGNPEPLFFSKGLRVKGRPLTLSRDTLKFWCTDGEVTYPAVGFGMGSLCDSVAGADSLDILYTPSIDTWHNEESLQLEIKDIRFLKG